MSALKKKSILLILISLFTFLSIVPVYAEDDSVYDVAMIGETGYKTLNAAIKAAGPDETIKMIRNKNRSDSIEISKKITLDLNGHTINFNSSATDDAIMITSDGDLTVVDSSDDKKGGITGIGKYDVFYCYGKLTIKSGNFKYNGSNTSGTVITNWSNEIAEGIVNISGGTFEGPTIIGNTGVGTVNISGGILNGTNNAVICYDNGKLNITGGTLEGKDVIFAYENTEENKITEVSISGGTINGTDTAVVSEGILNVTGGTFIGTNYGIFGQNGSASSSITIKGGTFESANGESLHLHNSYLGTAKISGGTFTGNVELNSPGDVTITNDNGTTFEKEVRVGTTAVENAKNVTIKDGVFEGLFIAENESRPQIYGGTFEGDMYSFNYGPEIRGGKFKDNPSVNETVSDHSNIAVGYGHYKADDDYFYVDVLVPVTVSANDKDMGYVKIEQLPYDEEGRYVKGQKITLQAYRNYGYDFVKWEDGSTKATRSDVTLKESDNTFIATYEDVSYVVSADSTVWTKGSSNGLTVKFTRKYNDDGKVPTGKLEISYRTQTYRDWINALDNGAVIKVDNKTLSESDYSAEEGSLVFTLNPTCLKDLSSGAHTLYVDFKDGSADAKTVEVPFTVKNAPTPTPSYVAPKTGIE